MFRTTHSRRPLQRLGLVGVGSAILFVGIAPAANAAEPVTIPFAPAEVGVTGFPIENFVGATDGMGMDPMGSAMLEPVAVEYGDALTVEVPADLVSADTVVTLAFDTNGDGNPTELEYSSATGAPNPLGVTGEGTGTLVITLPADDTINGPVAYLSVDPVTTDFGPEFFVSPIEYQLEIDAVTLAPVTLTPPLVADSFLDCATPAACTITTGSTTTFTLPSDSLLRQVGVSSFTGLEVVLQAVDGDGVPTDAPPVEAAVQVSGDGQSATFVVPDGTTAGSYLLLAAQPTAALGASFVFAEVTVAAPAAAAPTTAAAPAAPATAAPVNAGLRSNTGVEAVETGSTGDVAVAAGAGMLLLAGAGGVAVARNRRRAAAEGGTCGA